jgi:hypothetical protein
MIGGPQYHRWVKLAQYSFVPDGTVNEAAWYWNQDRAARNGEPSSASYLKVNSGYRTTGCQADCTVRTPVGFQPGATDSAFTPSRRGTWSNTAGGIVVQFNDGGREVWAQNTSWSGGVSLYTMSTGNSSTPTERPGPFWSGQMYGSNRSLNSGASIDTIKAKGKLTASNWLYDEWVSATRTAPASNTGKTTFNFTSYGRCAGPCIAYSNTNFGPGRPTSVQQSWYHSYLATDPTKNGRKAFWQHQVGAVTDAESPGSLCISPGGGHTIAMLQILDDNGAFIGFVGVEASLANQVPGNDAVASFTLL